MSQNRVLSLSFHPDHFPLAPNFIEFAVMETPDNVVIFTDAPTQRTADFVSLFTKEECGTALRLPCDAYHIEAKMLGAEGADQFKIVFSLLGSGDTVHDAITFDAAAYLADYQTAYENAPHTGSHDHDREFERNFSSAYLKKAFDEKIDGNDAFWNKFYEELDAACVPLNYRITQHMNGEPAKPVVVRCNRNLPRAANDLRL